MKKRQHDEEVKKLSEKLKKEMTEGMAVAWRGKEKKGNERGNDSKMKL